MPCLFQLSGGKDGVLLRGIGVEVDTVTGQLLAVGHLTPGLFMLVERRQLNLEIGTLRLEPGTTKNDQGREVYLTPALKSLLTAQIERVRALEREMGQIIPYLFPHLRGTHQGKRIQDFKRVWNTACLKAGCPGMLRHDFRRIAVRNMVNLGVEGLR